MYLPPAFREDDLPTLHAMMRGIRLANLVTHTPEGLVCTPLPLFLDPGEGPLGTLYGHLARANPHWKLPPTGDALAIFTGPNAYVSPSWYPSKA
jgi:transcriptional regulator